MAELLKWSVYIALAISRFGGSVQISRFHAKLNDLSQSSAVSAEAVLKQFEI